MSSGVSASNSLICTDTGNTRILSAAYGRRHGSSSSGVAWVSSHVFSSSSDNIAGILAVMPANNGLAFTVSTAHSIREPSADSRHTPAIANGMFHLSVARCGTRLRCDSFFHTYQPSASIRQRRASASMVWADGFWASGFTAMRCFAGFPSLSNPQTAQASCFGCRSAITATQLPGEIL